MEIAYYKSLNANPHFSLRNFAPLIKRAIADGESYYFKDGVVLGGVVYNVSFNPSTMALIISFEDEDGETIKRKIAVVEESSNLPSTSGAKVYYFLCPRKGVKCRKLYRVGSYFWSRKAFKALYPLQMESRHTRQTSYREEPYRRNGKEYYRGKLTPYGRRCIRYEEREESKVAALYKFIERSTKRLDNIQKRTR